MRYNPPKDDIGNEYYVPIVAKNKDFLIGYLRGISDSRDIMADVLESINIKLDLGPIEAVLDSTRFNDILQNGKHESEMTDNELEEYIYGIVEELTDKIIDTNSENNIDTKNVLNVECVCDLGYYAWREYNDIPEENFKCANCGRILIDYTDEYDYEYGYEYPKGEK